MFDTEKQKLLIELLLGNIELFARCNGIIKPKYFDASLSKSVNFIQNYFETYREIPLPQIVKGETGLVLEVHELSKAEQKYVATEIETFCRNSAVIDAIMQGPDLHEKGDYDTIWQLIKEASAISLNRDLGINYFENVEARLNDLLNNSPTILTGWDDVDEATGGLVRQEMLLLAANSGIGKSIIMSNLAVNLVERGYNVIYFTFELADKIVCKRFDSMVTGIGQKEILNKIPEVVSKVNNLQQKAGQLFVKRYPESVTNANHIRAYVKEFEQTHGFLPDVIMLDYLDLMASNKNISHENIWLADKYKAEECRALGFDFDCAVVTASQLGRGAIEAEKVTQGHIQGGISKVQTADIMVSIIQSDQMRAAGEYIFEYTKTRNSGAVGSHTILKWDPIALRVTNYNEAAEGLKLLPKSKDINTILNNTSTIFTDGKFNVDGKKTNLLDLLNKT